MPSLRRLLSVSLVALCAGAVTPPVAAATTVLRDLAVPTSDGATIPVDVWQPGSSRRTQARPIAFLVHGGGWQSGDKRQWERSGWARRLSNRGWVVVNADYRLACDPAVPSGLPAAMCGYPMRTSLGDVRLTLRFTAARARTWGGDPQRIVLFGVSAGAQLAMLAGSDPIRPPGVLAVVAISPPADLEWIAHDPALPVYRSAVRSIGCDLATCPAGWRRASPMAQVKTASTPPTWLFDAAADPITPIEPVRRYRDTLRAVGIRTVLATPADATASCHGALACADVPLRGSSLDMFQHALAWLRPLL
jgi:acetyl esterase/lipase